MTVACKHTGNTFCYFTNLNPFFALLNGKSWEGGVTKYVTLIYLGTKSVQTIKNCVT